MPCKSSSIGACLGVKNMPPALTDFGSLQQHRVHNMTTPESPEYGSALWPDVPRSIGGDRVPKSLSVSVGVLRVPMVSV